MNELPLDVLLYNIMTDPELLPYDILGLCQQPGFVLLCKLPKVGRALMNRYYPNVPIDPNNPWRQFRVLAGRTKIRYVAYINNNDISRTIRHGELFGVTEMENYRSMLVGRRNARMMLTNQTEIYVDVYGVPIGGPHLIGGITEIDGEDNEYTIYNDYEDAIQALWNKLGALLEEHSDPTRKRIIAGELRYRSPIDHRESYDAFREDMIQRGYSFYHYHETHEHRDYGDFSDFGTIIFSIHQNVHFVN